MLCGELIRGSPHIFIEMSVLRISHYIIETRVLGPYKRSALWVNGCCFNCDGCIAKDMNNRQPVLADTSELARIFIDASSTEGITISGGEPFLQSRSLAEMIDKIREKRDYGVIVYSGFTYDELLQKNDTDVENLLSRIDVLVDGKYIQELDDGMPYRGSSNQKIIPLSDRYNFILNDYYNNTNKRNIEIQIDSNHFYLVGVPSKNGLRTWEELTRKAKEHAF